MKNDKTVKKTSSNITLNSFITVAAILLSLLIFAGMLSYFIPQGSLSLDENGVIITDSYTKGEVKGIAALGHLH